MYYRDVHKSEPRLIRPRIVEMIKNGDQNVQNVGRLQNVEQKLFVSVAHLPEQHQQLLVKVNALARS